MSDSQHDFWREAAPSRAGDLRQQHTAGDLAGELERQVRDRPWLAVGVAVAAGYLLGSGDDRSGRGMGFGPGTHAQLDRELDLLKSAAFTALSGKAREAMRSGARELAQQGAPERGGQRRSTAPNAAANTGTGGEGATFDSPPMTSSSLPNPGLRGTEHAAPYYPPGGPRGPVSREGDERS